MRRLMGDDVRRERSTQQRLVSRIANNEAPEVRKALTTATRAAASAFEREGAQTSIGPGIAEQRDRIKRRIEAMYTGAWGTFSDRIERAAFEKSGAGAGEFKQSEDEVADRLAEAQRAFVAEQAAEQIERVINTTRQQVDAIITQGTREGVGIDEIARRIRSTGRDMARFRSELIARTEVHKAGMKAQDEAARATGVAKRREWVAAIDGRTRDDRFSHVDADGEIVDMDGEFERTGERLRYPGDSLGSAGNIINCRCGVGYIIE
jgi:uncharacterized protein with gpF-like domain